jgi:23S rRNA (guanosine2251-2'-O)-methyltransferase
VVADPALRDELLAMAERELGAADAFFARCASEPTLQAELDRRLAGPLTAMAIALAEWDARPPEADTLLRVNDDTARRLDEIVAAGWPGLRSVGAVAADAAWLLAEHADRANETRLRWLGALADAVGSGDADPRHLATLVDRVAAVAGQAQTYGTIVMLAADGEVEFPLPVDDLASLDARREAIGLPPLSADAAFLDEGDLVPYGPERGSVPVNQWPMTVEGHVSVEAALEAGVRPIHRVWAVRPGDRRLGRLRALARERGVTIEPVAPEIIDDLASGRTHGGVIGLVGSRRERSVPKLIGEVGEGSLLVMLDGIEDPFNYGQAVRALYAAGVDGLLTRRSWETALTTVTRASAGATELIPTASTPDAETAAHAARAAGMRVACAVSDRQAIELHDADLTGGVFLLIGGERRGVTRSFIDQADLRLRIDYGREGAPDLGAATAAAIIGFEALRQRRMAAG